VAQGFCVRYPALGRVILPSPKCKVRVEPKFRCPALPMKKSRLDACPRCWQSSHAKNVVAIPPRPVPGKVRSVTNAAEILL